ncbi:MAG: hypothetical protein NTZ74_01430 [Chloroflexi bacterium]|nr:hypothetical protein [Chloroflexota bacterium]
MSSIIPDLELPILVVDEIHWQKANPGGREALEYSISSHEGFRLSTQDFEFILPERVPFKQPNTIQIVAGKDQLFARAFEPGCTLHTLDRSTLVPLYGSRTFEGFHAGTKLIIAIGHLSPPREELPQPKFIILWAGVVNIR